MPGERAARDGPRPAKALILTASMGGGHVQVSRELARRLTDLGWQATVVDTLGATPRWGDFLRRLYPWMVNEAPWLYDLVYRRFFLAGERSARRAWLPIHLATRDVRRRLDEEAPDVVVSTYHLAAVAAARLRAAGELTVPTLTFITTFGVHDLWVHPGADAYLCITPQAAAALAERTAAPIEVCEPVVRQPFTTGAVTAPRPPGCRALVVAGALGMGPVADAVRVVADLPGWTPVVVCGRNERLRDELVGVDGAEVQGWVEDMAGLMASTDVVIDNAGGSTAKEALALGRPVVTFRPIAGHGRHDALMMEDAGLTEVVDAAEDLAAALRRLQRPPDRDARAARGRALFGRDPARVIIEQVQGAAVPTATSPT